MTDHKFEPFQKVLVRDEDGRAWNASFFSHIADDSDYKFMACGIFWKQCIPYTPVTAHLLGTSQPYEPPKPPQEYEWGQKVEVNKNKVWVKGVISYTEKDSSSAAVIVKGEIHASIYPPERIRPLPDDTAAH